MLQMNSNIKRFEVFGRNFLLALQSSSSQPPISSPPQPEMTSNPQKSNSQPNVSQPQMSFIPLQPLYDVQDARGPFNMDYSLGF
jgi:hypothetical protein